MLGDGLFVNCEAKWPVPPCPSACLHCSPHQSSPCLFPPGLLLFTETSMQSLPVVPCGEVLSAPVSGLT